MSASRWYANLAELLEWVGTVEPAFDDVFLPSILTRLQKKEEPEKPAEPEPLPEEAAVRYPEVLPILPLRGVVVFPQTAVPLTIGQPRSIKLMDDVSSADRLIGVVAARNPEIENPAPADLFPVGTIAVVHRLFRAPDNTIRLLVQGLVRFRLGEVVQTEPYLKARVELDPEHIETGLEMDALARNARDQFEHIAEMSSSIPKELVMSISALEDPLQTIYTIANFQRMELQDAQQILEMNSTQDKLHKLVGLLVREAEVLQLGQKIQNEARSEIEKVQKDYFLREQLKAIQKELGERDEQVVEVEEFRKKIEAARMSEESDKQAKRELERLARLPTAAAEYGVIRTYLDWLVTLPWAKSTTDNLDIANARKILDQDHYGLEDVKERILEFLAIRKLRLERRGEAAAAPRDAIRREREGVILCFVGPPGVGKTSLGQSIARAMERKFIRTSLGGMRDEAEIRGHRRTYIGAMPGRILQALRRIESGNPVFMLDEVDKLVFDFHGDPASALLEVLDPEQNVEFRDHYLEVAYNLSQVFFITTANTLETIPGPLLDRMEVIHLSGYTESEKITIARDYLIPRQIRENGLHPDEVKFTRRALSLIINRYTREAGVRNLERTIGSVCRKIGTLIAEGKQQPASVTPGAIKDLLGHPLFQETEEISARTAIPGVAPGLAWTPFGGDVLFIEATRMPGSKGFQLTGSLGNVMQESARAALSYVRSRAEDLGLEKEFFDKADIHMHIPSGAQPKDGPSAGVTMATALVSLISGRSVRKGVGMTGEITLRGQVLPVGGIKEKMLAAHRSGLKTVILPRRNKLDLEDVPDEVKKNLKFVFADTVDDVLKTALSKKKPPSAPAAQPAQPEPEKETAKEGDAQGAGG
jgi:ATP-dependent Lon protease